jgi:hypothetical protein
MPLTRAIRCTLSIAAVSQSSLSWLSWAENSHHTSRTVSNQADETETQIGLEKEMSDIYKGNERQGYRVSNWHSEGEAKAKWHFEYWNESESAGVPGYVSGFRPTRREAVANAELLLSHNADPLSGQIVQLEDGSVDVLL